MSFRCFYITSSGPSFDYTPSTPLGLHYTALPLLSQVQQVNIQRALANPRQAAPLPLAPLDVYLKHRQSGCRQTQQLPVTSNKHGPSSVLVAGASLASPASTVLQACGEEHTSFFHHVRQLERRFNYSCLR